MIASTSPTSRFVTIGAVENATPEVLFKASVVEVIDIQQMVGGDVVKWQPARSQPTSFSPSTHRARTPTITSGAPPFIDVTTGIETTTTTPDLAGFLADVHSRGAVCVLLEAIQCSLFFSDTPMVIHPYAVSGAPQLLLALVSIGTVQ